MVVWEVGFEAHCLSSVPREINVGEGELSTNLQENNTVLLGGPGMEGSQSHSGMNPQLISCATLVQLCKVSESQVLICSSVFGEEQKYVKCL